MTFAWFPAQFSELRGTNNLEGYAFYKAVEEVLRDRQGNGMDKFYYELANMAVGLGFYDEARQWCDKLLALAPEPHMVELVAALQERMANEKRQLIKNIAPSVPAMTPAVSPEKTATSNTQQNPQAHPVKNEGGRPISGNEQRPPKKLMVSLVVLALGCGLLAVVWRFKR
jgi:hypothetical protein